jgi:hypothetical protein
MAAKRLWIVAPVTLAAIASLVAAVSGAGCSAADDGASCDEDDDCHSSHCVDGTCSGSTCDCASGVCTSGTSCQGGWVCVKESLGASNAFPVCRRLCPDGTGCFSFEHCQDGVCHEGASAPKLSWANIPRDAPCPAFSECPFEVKVTGGSGAIDHYAWRFDDTEKDAPPVETPDPRITHKYSPGQHTTIVTAFDANGTEASLSALDSLCVDGEQLQCTPNVVDCCLGTCNPEGGCR